MGVHGLTGILSRYAPTSVREIRASTLGKQTIAFDASCHLNKFIYGEEQVPHRHVHGFYQLARFCQLNKITPIFVFDGPQRLAAKHLEHAKRARTRHKIKHSLLFEKDQSTRLDAWSEVTESLLGQQELYPQDNATCYLPPVNRDIETKIISIAKELRLALSRAENNEKYTRTVRDLAIREDDLVSDMILNRLKDVKSSLKTLKRDNLVMTNSLEKRSFQITQAMRTECQDFLKALGFVCFSTDDHEAEAMCANLSKLGRTTATVSEDLDTLAFGDAPILRHFFSKARPILEIDPIKARNELGLSRSSFIDLCILCGTDFSGTISGIGPQRALQWIQRYGSIEEVLNNIYTTSYIPNPTFDYQLARHVFNDLPPIPSHDNEYIGSKQSQSFIDDLLKFYEIDPIDIEVKLRSSHLTQNIIDSSQWGINPFSSNPISNDLFQFN